MRLKALFEEKRRRGEKALVAYLTAGDPDFETSVRAVETVIAAGADVVELGVPHSDPVADGPVNARAAGRAIAAGGGMRQTLRIALELRARGVTAPLVLFSYYNPILRMGLAAFADACAESGVDAVLGVDLPPEEAGQYRAELGRRQISTVFLAAPTTPPERVRLLGEASSGFLYYVSRAGVTGARASLPPTLPRELETVRGLVRLPVCVGFGISSPEQAAALAPHCDGVVVGSALVECLERAGTVEARLAALGELTRGIANALKNQESKPC